MGIAFRELQHCNNRNSEFQMLLPSLNSQNNENKHSDFYK